jgi:L-threonylcarbamoyladenylate synthase
MAEILKASESPPSFAMDYAARLIRAGKVVAVPTDTLYGLAADPFNLAAVNEIFCLKHRKADQPLPLLVASLEQAAELTVYPPADLLLELAKRFWPGPLTIVVAAAQHIPLRITAHTGKLGLRWPRAPLVEALIDAAGRPLTGTSANLSDHPPCRTAEEVNMQIGDALPLILDGGPAPCGVASSVVEIVGDRIRLLRPGGIPETELKEFLI